MPTQFTSAVKPKSVWDRIRAWLFPPSQTAPAEIAPVYANVDGLAFRDIYARLLGAEARFVVFRNGTCVRLQADEGEQDAITKLRQHGRVVAGTSSGDFRIEEVLDRAGYLVSFDHPDIVVFVPRDYLPVFNEAMNDIIQGMHGRTCRSVDAKFCEIVATQVGPLSAL
jgi:hypothetical protein